MGDRDDSNDGMCVVITDGVDEDSREGVVVGGKVGLNDDGGDVNEVVGINEGCGDDGLEELIIEGGDEGSLYG